MAEVCALQDTILVCVVSREMNLSNLFHFIDHQLKTLMLNLSLFAPQMGVLQIAKC